MAELREHWGSKLGFFFAAVGSAVGLGLLWKFPFTIKENGGGLFLLSYLGCLFLIGVPVFIGELILGRASKRAAVGAFEVLAPSRPSWKIAGWLGVSASFLIMSYYSVIGGWGISYVLMSLFGFYQGKSIEEVGQVFTTLSHSGGITVLWHAVFTLITMGIVFSGVRKGIEYWSKLMTRALLLLLIALFFFCIRLDGFSDALHFVFHPDPSRFKLSSLLEALGLAFFTMSLGQGIMISYGSYMRSNMSVVSLSSVVASSVMVVAILAAMTIFPVLFSFPVEKTEGVGLVFQTLPYLFGQLPASLLVSTGFFILFVFAGLTSAIPLIEVVATNLMELHGFSRRRAVVMVASGTFILGIPSAYSFSGGVFPQWASIYGMNFFRTMDNLVSVWLIPIAALFTTLFLGFLVPVQQLKEEFTSGSSGRAGLFICWRLWVRWVVPLLILAILLQKSGLINFDKGLL